MEGIVVYKKGNREFAKVCCGALNISTSEGNKTFYRGRDNYWYYFGPIRDERKFSGRCTVRLFKSSQDGVLVDFVSSSTELEYDSCEIVPVNVLKYGRDSIVPNYVASGIQYREVEYKGKVCIITSDIILEKGVYGVQAVIKDDLMTSVFINLEELVLLLGHRR